MRNPVNHHNFFELFICKYFAVMLYYIIAALFVVSISSQAVEISEYIWVDYGQIPTQNYDEQYVRARLPCQARIGKCTYKYDQIPRGWFSL